MNKNESFRTNLSTLFSNIKANSDTAEKWLVKLEALGPTDGTKELRDIIVLITNDALSANKILREANAARYSAPEGAVNNNGQ